MNEYAELLHVTPGYLNDVIKLSIGISAKDFIQRRLFLEAKRIKEGLNLDLKILPISANFSKIILAYLSWSL
jgi:AraC family transcriptional regulator, transcriptional activator of pobA